MIKRSGPFALAVVVAIAVPGAVDGAGPGATRYVLTLNEARELARAQSPRILAARARVEVARGDRVGASVWQPTNPELAFAAGPRRSDGEKIGTDVDIEIGQTFELGGRRRARLERADAGIARADRRARDEERLVLREVSARFLASLHAQRSLEIARDNERVVRELHEVTERRFEAGDVGILDPSAAATALARARIRVAEVEAQRAMAAADLRTLLGLEEDADVVPEGDLTERGRYTRDALNERAADRADLAEIEAAIAQVRAEQRLGRARRAPDLGAFASFGREEGAEIFQGGLKITLPVLDRGQGRTAAADAEERALRVELQARRSAVDREVDARLEAFAILDSAASEFGIETLPRLDRMLELARRSYEAGNTPFSEFLVLQREVVDARQAYLDLLYRAALAETELEAAAGVM